MARLTLTFDPPTLNPGATTPVSKIHDDITYQTSKGPKLGSALVAGDAFCPRPGTALVIATITPEA